MELDVKKSPKKKGTFAPQTSRADQTAFQNQPIGLCDEKQRYYQDKENNAQNNGDPEQRALNAATGSEDTASVSACEPAQACALALQDNADNQQERDYNQRDI
jgi:hypothetical protein